MAQIFLSKLSFGGTHENDPGGLHPIDTNFQCVPLLEAKTDLTTTIPCSSEIGMRFTKSYPTWTCLAAALTSNRKIPDSFFVLTHKTKGTSLPNYCHKSIDFEASFWALWLINNFQFKNKGFYDWRWFPHKYAINPLLYWHCSESESKGTHPSNWTSAEKCEYIMNTFKTMDFESENDTEMSPSGKERFAVMMEKAHPVFGMIRAKLFNYWRQMLLKEGKFSYFIQSIYARGVQAIEQNVRPCQAYQFFHDQPILTEVKNKPLLWGTW